MQRRLSQESNAPRQLIQERAGAKLVLTKAAKQSVPRLKKVIADDGYKCQRASETKVLLASV